MRNDMIQVAQRAGASLLQIAVAGLDRKTVTSIVDVGSARPST